MFPRDSDEQRKVMYEAQLRTNELLTELVSLLAPKEVEMKRPDMLKMIASMENKPDGFNKWSNEKLRDFLKGK